MTEFFNCTSIYYSPVVRSPTPYEVIRFLLPDNDGQICINYDSVSTYYTESDIGTADSESLYVYRSLIGDNYWELTFCYNPFGTFYSLSDGDPTHYTVLELSATSGDVDSYDFPTVSSLNASAIRLSSLHGPVSQISGNNGSWTNTDDVKKVDKAEAARRAAQSARDKKKNSGISASGHGKFKLKNLGKAIGKAGGLLSTGAQIAGMLSGAGAYNFTGSGSYDTIGNETLTGVKTHDVPTFRRETDDSGDIYLAYEEYVGKVYSPSVSGAFDVQVYAMNPGMPGSFPYMSQIAMNFQQYEFSGLIATFKPNTGLIQSGSMGFVTMVYDYNAASSPPTSPQMVKNMGGQVTGTPIQTILCGCECDNTKLLVPGGRYVRSGSVPSGQDIKTYDMAQLYVCLYAINSTAFPVNTVLGELHLSYKVRLIKPKLYETLGYAIPTDSFISNVTGVTASMPFGTAPMKSTHNYIGGALSKSTNSVYTFPDWFSGTVLVQLYVYGATPAWASPTISGNIKWAYMYSNTAGNAPQQNLQAPLAASGDRQILLSGYIVEQATSSGGNTLTFTIASGAPSLCELVVSMSNPLIGRPWTEDYTVV